MLTLRSALPDPMRPVVGLDPGVLTSAEGTTLSGHVQPLLGRTLQWRTLLVRHDGTALHDRVVALAGHTPVNGHLLPVLV